MIYHILNSRFVTISQFLNYYSEKIDSSSGIEIQFEKWWAVLTLHLWIMKYFILNFLGLFCIKPSSWPMRFYKAAWSTFGSCVRRPRGVWPAWGRGNMPSPWCPWTRAAPSLWRNSCQCKSNKGIRPWSNLMHWEIKSLILCGSHVR